MYDIIYDFLETNIYNSNTLTSYSQTILGNETTLQQWLCHSTCIALMVVAVILACLLVRWVWRLVSSAMLLK